MTVWMIRGGRSGEQESVALEKGVAVIGWNELPDLSKCKTREELAAVFQATYPGMGDGRLHNNVGQVWAFAKRVNEGDLVVLPRKRSATIAVGRAKGPYAYRTDLGDIHHARPVEWLRMDIPRTSVDSDLLYSLGAFMTVCRIERNNAEARIQAMVQGKPAPTVAAGPKENDGEEDAPLDIEEVARGQISTHILQKFKGHPMTALVEAVLRAQGYVTEVSLPGADGGVDILAGSGPLGLMSPRLCVQVKSQQSAADVTVFRALQGAMGTFGAEQGLLVCWGGFTKAVHAEARLSYFKVRLWDAAALVDAVLANYERFSADLQAELPLKRTWALVLEE